MVIILLIKSWTRTTDQSARRHISGDFSIQLVRSPEQNTKASYPTEQIQVKYSPMLQLVLIQSLHLML
jgi:hypothetical protein